MRDNERKSLLKPIKITACIEPHIREDSNPTTWFEVSCEDSTFSWPVEIGRYLDDNGEVDWTRTLENFSACRHYILKYLANVVTQAIEHLVEESCLHGLSESELADQFASSLDLKQWEEDFISDTKRQDERVQELQAAGIPHDELVAIIEQETIENPSFQREWFQYQIISFAHQIKARLSGHRPWYVDSGKKWSTHGFMFNRFPFDYYRLRSIWSDVRRYQKEQPRSVKKEQRREQIIDHYKKQLIGATDMVDYLFELDKKRAYKWSPSELAIVHAARNAGFRGAKMGQARGLFDVLNKHPKYHEARNLYGGNVEQ